MVLDLSISCWNAVKFFVFALLFSNCFSQISVPKVKEVLVVIGNYSLDDEIVNVGLYDPSTETWLTLYQTVSVSEVDCAGVLLDIAINRSSSEPYDKFYVVGSFDTVTKTSQVQFCSVATWNGISFDKVTFLVK